MTLQHILQGYTYDDMYKINELEKIKNEKEPFNFYGHNCNYFKHYDEEKCIGWDGCSSRCYCGNRRVAWFLNDDKTEIYAKAW